ncbi:MAG: tetratricopeptide repeat protein, partial [Deltaproteobacteria bacterium]|nr:tetratricopeptide repeat protein [Deltaproteobacteria bacterium]
MPGIGSDTVRDHLVILLGVACEAEAVAETIVRNRKVRDSDGLKTRYRDLLSQYRSELEIATASAARNAPPGLMGMLKAEPAEAIDIMEILPETGVLIRLFEREAQGNTWTAFVVTPDDVRTASVSLTGLQEEEQAGPVVVAYERAAHLPPLGKATLALSATHLFRSFENRNPFRRKVLALPSLGHLPLPFTEAVLDPSAEEKDILAELPGAHTLWFDGPVTLGGSVPTRQGRRPEPRVFVKLKQGRGHSLTSLAGLLGHASLVATPRASLKAAYPVGHILSLYGVPSVLISRIPQTGSKFVSSFFEAYVDASLQEAVQEGEGRSGSTEDRIVLGYWGMAREAAHAFARRRFKAVVRQAAAAFKAKTYAIALARFEDALDVASETGGLARYLPDLHRYARESAYQIGDLATAEAHARALADLLEDTRPDSEPHARALLTLGLIKARAEQYDQAIAVLEEALEMMAFLELGPEQINALAQVGVVLENAVEYDRALERFRSAASLSKTMDKKRLLARQHTSIGRVYDLRLNQYAKARVSYAKAFEIYRELEDPEGMALALLDMGRCHRLMGNFNKATAHFQRTLNLIGEDPAFERISAKTRMEQANNAWFQARYQEAFDLQQGVFELSRERQWQLEQVMALNTGGLIWWTLGDRERALRELKDALSLAERLNVRQDEVATTLNNLGLVYRDMGLYEEAIQALNQALAIDRKINSRWGIAYDLKNLALTHVRMGRPKKALPFFEEALQHATAIGNRINQAKILVGLGESLALLHRPAEASDAFRTALAHAEAMAVRETRWRALYGLSGISLGNGDVS